jgi:hypothetical protein
MLGSAELAVRPSSDTAQRLIFLSVSEDMTGD